MQEEKCIFYPIKCIRNPKYKKTNNKNSFFKEIKEKLMVWKQKDFREARTNVHCICAIWTYWRDKCAEEKSGGFV